MTKAIRISAIALALSLAGVSASAVAQEGPGRGDRMARGEKMVEQLDTNGDGAVSKAEVDASRAAAFAAADTNGDGGVSQAEVLAYQEAQRAERRAAREAEMFARADTNGDGVLGPDEFGPRVDRMFEALDKDDDGMITAEEREEARESWRERRGERRRGRGEGGGE